jgi:hypothetical protein
MVQWGDVALPPVKPGKPMSISITSIVSSRGRVRALVPLCAGVAVYLFLLFIGEILLKDSDSIWQIKTGQWILANGAVPYTDLYSFTQFGKPWMSNSWLSQVLFSIAYGPGDWAGPVILSSIAIGASIAIFVHLLSRYFDPARAIVIAMLALLLAAPHFLARPHVLALPVMLAFVGGLMAAADRRTHPSWFLLPLMALWSNLHGGFVLGLALIGAIGLEAVWSADAERRLGLVFRWMLFGIGALVASCCTPYGWKTLLAAANILNLGELLTLIAEWQPASFTTFSVFEAVLLGLIALGFHRGVVLSPPRILLILGLTWMALSHQRNIGTFAFLVPLVLAAPFAAWSDRTKADRHSAEGSLADSVAVLATLMFVTAACVSTSLYAAHHRFAITTEHMPVAAVDILSERKAQRIFNAYQFGGYLIARDIPIFIDGRAELYGEQFVMDFFNAIEAKKLDNLTRLLEDYRIDATLLVTGSPAAQVLDHFKGWKRLYADDIAVIHVRDDRKANLSAPSEAAN